MMIYIFILGGIIISLMYCWSELNDSSKKRIIGLILLCIFLLGPIIYPMYVMIGRSDDMNACGKFSTSGKCIWKWGHLLGGISMGVTVFIHSIFVIICIYNIRVTIIDNPNTLIIYSDKVSLIIYSAFNVMPLIFSMLDIMTNNERGIYVLFGNLIPILLLLPWVIYAV